jgi:hypothetical protein
MIVQTSKRMEGPTPAGGEYGVVYFLNDAGEPADEAVATRFEFIEYDTNGDHVERSYGTIEQ